MALQSYKKSTLSIVFFFHIVIFCLIDFIAYFLLSVAESLENRGLLQPPHLLNLSTYNVSNFSIPPEIIRN